MTPGVIKIPTDVEGVGMKSFLTRLWQEEEGQDLTEYGLLLVLVALAAITSMSTLANAIKTVFSTAAANLSSS
jgi:pilus assembly protein Flp/PilA